jgi:hypothetical protein
MRRRDAEQQSQAKHDWKECCLGADSDAAMGTNRSLFHTQLQGRSPVCFERSGSRRAQISLSAIDPFLVRGKTAWALLVSEHGSGCGVSTIVPSIGVHGIVDFHCFFVETYEERAKRTGIALAHAENQDKFSWSIAGV